MMRHGKQYAYCPECGVIVGEVLLHRTGREWRPEWNYTVGPPACEHVTDDVGLDAVLDHVYTAANADPREG